ncbi:XrtA/PEP-CTERM system-associated ATPase [Govanella unica]|uniref:XrtA-associated ATPase n=1 Tax=Govanella unica TaxID=2975056 RepID=A0A9X3TXK7_9PROT|nr:XrtA/PEP-CTERM system-associated ATPase [Govania unica]MDA5193603.1 XrtA-associated ATPase [Govania unica]
MYAEFYNLSSKPFQLTPDPRFYYNSSTHKKAMAYLTYGLNQGEGFIIITGDIGAGKTTLVGHLFDELDRDRFVACKVVTTQIGADDTLRMVAAGFGLPTEGADKATLLLRIEQYLRAQYRAGKRALLVIDEAQNLPTRALEELRMLSNFQEGEHALLQSFLLGQPEFREKWALDPELEQLRQRVIATHHLEPMTAEETRGYILHRLELVGWNNDPHFSEEAFSAIYKYTNGVPRRLNSLCARIMLYGAIEELRTMSAEVVEDVIADLERDNRAASAKLQDASQLSQLKHKLDDVAATAGFRSNGTGGDYGASLDEISRRLDVLEQYVRMHDQTIKQALDLAAKWLEDSGEQHDKPAE